MSTEAPERPITQPEEGDQEPTTSFYESLGGVGMEGTVEASEFKLPEGADALVVDGKPGFQSN